jgi:hypothetical protein
MMRRERKPQTISSAAVASNPGQLDVQFSVFCRCFPRAPVVIGVCSAIPLGMALLMHPAFLIPGMLLGPSLAYAYVGRARDHFWFGCVNPAVVVSHDPDLIAVYSDLSAGVAPCPVVKVLPHPLKRMTGGRLEAGTRLAAVALYEGPIRQRQQRPASGAGGRPTGTGSQIYILPPHWSNFHPVAVNCATAEPAEIERVLASIAAREWEAMDVALPQVPTPYRPGLYRIELPRHLIWT